MGKFRNTPLGHELFYALRFVGLRDRFRCPECRAVGTWKPHGGVVDKVYDRITAPGETYRTTRRWLCKYCGFYEGPEGQLRAHPDRERPWWVLPAPHDPESLPENELPTPEEIVKTGYDKSVWPWRG